MKNMWRTIAVIIGISELLFFVAVLVSPSTINEQRYVSTNLFKDLYFRILLTIFVVCHIGICVAYVLQFRLKERLGCALALFFQVGALLGWILTISFNPATDSYNHNLGAGMYIVATSLYYIIMLNLAFHTDPVLRYPYDILALTIFLCTTVFVLLYIVLYFTDKERSWIFENIAFVSSVLAYLAFFGFHSFDPFKPISPLKAYVDYECPASPLLNRECGRLHSIY